MNKTDCFRHAHRSFLLLLTILGASGCSGPWDDLEKRYTTDTPTPATSISGKTIVLAGTNHHGAYNYRGIVNQSFNSSGVYLGLEFPFSFWNEPLSIPLSSITACNRTQWSPGWDTNLWIGDTQVEIAFPDNDGSVIEWCRKMEIKIVDRETARKWLYQGRGDQ